MLIFMGLFCIVAGAGQLVSMLIFWRRRARRSASARGTVTQIHTITRRGGRPLVTAVYCPEVCFQSPTGEVRTFTSPVGENPPRHTPGQEVEVVYDPANLTNVEIRGATEATTFGFMPGCMFVMSLGWLALGLFFLATGIGTLLKR